MSNLEPLEFKECVVDSPWFREKLLLHEKEIEENVKNFNDIHSSIENVYRALEDCSIAFDKLADNLTKFTSNEDQNLSGSYNFQAETADEKIIRCSVQIFSELISNIEVMRRKHILGESKNLIMKEIQELGSGFLSLAKQNIKEFRKATTTYYSKLDKYSAIKFKPDAEYYSVDADFQNERHQFAEIAMKHVMIIEEAEEKKTSKLVHTLSLMMQTLKTYHHEVFDHIEDQVKEIGQIDVNVHRALESYCSISTDTNLLMKQILSMPIEHVQPDSDVEGEIRREGYLFVLTKKQLWTRRYCIYEKNSKKLSLIMASLPSQAGSLKIQQDDYDVISCEGKLVNASERRFSFDLKVENQTTPLTLQALTKEDLKQWLLIMDGKEPIYSKPCKHGSGQELKCSFNEKTFKLMSMCFSEIEKRGLDFVGLYRLGGRKTDIGSLVEKMIEYVNDYSNESLSARDLDSEELTTLTSAIKQLISRLKIPLATYKLYSDFIAVGKLQSNEDKFNALLKVVRKLPVDHFEMFTLVLKHLNNVSLHEEDNKMPAPNLSVCFSPVIFQPKEGNTSSTVLKETKFAIDVLTVMIERCDELFSSGNCPENVTLSASKSMKLSKEERDIKIRKDRSQSMQVGVSNYKQSNELERQDVKSHLTDVHQSNIKVTVTKTEIENHDRIDASISERRSSDTSLLQCDKGLTLDESVSSIRAIMNQLKSVATFTDLKTLSEVAKQMSQLFFDCPNYLKEHIDVLLELDFTEYVVRALKKLNNMGISKSDEIWFSSYYFYEICRNYSNVSFEFASSLGQSGLASLLIVNIGHKPYLEKLTSSSINFIVKTSLNIIRNMCRFPGNCVLFRTNAVKESLRTLISLDQTDIRLFATVCLALLVSESDTCLLCGDENNALSKDDVLVNIINYTREARNSDRKKIMGFRCYDLLQAIRSATSVEIERRHFIDVDGLSLLKEFISGTSVATSEELVECLEILCNLGNSIELRPKLLKAGITSNLVQVFMNSDNVRVKSAAQDYLWRLELNEINVDKVVPVEAVYQSSVYICYASINQSVILKLQNRLVDTGLVKVIDPENRLSSGSVKVTIQKCAIVIVCLSEALKSHPRYQLEVEYCDRLSKPVIPVLIQQKYRPDGWLQRLVDRKINLFNLSSKIDFDANWESLIGHIKSQLQQCSISCVDGRPMRLYDVSSADSDIVVWFERNGLSHLKTQLGWLDLKLLKSFQRMKKHAHEYFYQTLERKLKLELIDILKFSDAVDNV